MKTIAVDFDNTLFFVDDWPTIGEPNWPLINRVKEEIANGNEIVLWTTREGKYLDDAIWACSGVGIEFTAINDNTPYRIELWGDNPRKIGADEYWDDRAVNTRELV